MAASDLTAQRVRELLDYNPDTGVFIWRNGVGGIKAGAVAGSLKPTGYRRIRADGHFCYEHRLAHLFMTGDWPESFIDHINGDRCDNRWANLRLATKLINNQNTRRPRSDNKTSGLLGVSWMTRERKYRAQIWSNGTNISIGRFKTPEEAHAAYIEAKRLMHPGCTI
jgi:hypothetical protein